METQSTNLPITDPDAFNQRYVSTNIRPGAPCYSSELVAKLRAELCALNEGFEVYSYAVLVCNSLRCAYFPRDLVIDTV